MTITAPFVNGDTRHPVAVVMERRDFTADGEVIPSVGFVRVACPFCGMIHTHDFDPARPFVQARVLVEARRAPCTPYFGEPRPERDYALARLSTLIALNEVDYRPESNFDDWLREWAWLPKHSPRRQSEKDAREIILHFVGRNQSPSTWIDGLDPDGRSTVERLRKLDRKYRPPMPEHLRVLFGQSKRTSAPD